MPENMQEDSLFDASNVSLYGIVIGLLCLRLFDYNANILNL